MELKSILNPAPECLSRYRSSKVTRSAVVYYDTSSPSSYSPGPTSTKKSRSMKAPKDAPKWEEGSTNGPVHYPPFNVSLIQLAKLKQDFDYCAGPKENARLYPEYIPYSSDKKNFFGKTGREGFNVFHYTFSYKDGSDAEKDWVVLWDYNNGLTRITPFFKCMPGHRKTDPKNAIMASPGLMDLCYSITGGAILAQGYWLPYATARALAATFTYPIRQALVPIFGPSFPEICRRPQDPLYKHWTIPANIVASCVEQVEAWTRASKMETVVPLTECYAVDASGTGRNLRRKSRLRPRDVGVYDIEDLDHDLDTVSYEHKDVEEQNEVSENEVDTDDDSASSTPETTDSDYEATPLGEPDLSIAKSTWTTANRPIYPTPPRQASPFLDAGEAVWSDKKTRKRRIDSECINPRTTKRKCHFSGDNSVNSPPPPSPPNANANLQKTAKTKAKAKARAKPTAPNRTITTTTQAPVPTSDQSTTDPSDRRVNRRQGTFYADEVRAAQSLLRMSEGCWGDASR